MAANPFRAFPIGLLFAFGASLAAGGDAPVAPPPGPLDLIRSVAATMRGAEPDTAKVEASILWSRYGLPLGSKDLSGDLGPLVKALAGADKDPEAKVIEDGGTAPHRFARCDVVAAGATYRVTLVEEDGWRIARVASEVPAPPPAGEKPAAASPPPETRIDDAAAIARLDKAVEEVVKTIDAHDTKAFLALHAPVWAGSPAQMGEAFGEPIVARLHEKYGQRSHRLGAARASKDEAGRRRASLQVLFGEKEDLAVFRFLEGDDGVLRLESVDEADATEFVPR